jgi:hypothetical protein
MPNVSRLQLDVLKPHKPNAYDFTVALSTVDPTWSFSLDVVEIDEQTESICLIVSGMHIDLDILQAKLTELGATVHSIDTVETSGEFIVE